jgi:hypothetical protein
MQEMELMHKDARSDAAALRRHCAEMKAASEAAKEAQRVQLESMTAQWEFRLSKRESDLLATQQLLKSQLATFEVQCESMQQELKDAKTALVQQQNASALGREKLDREVQEAKMLAVEATAQNKEHEQQILQKDAEIIHLHRQVCCRSGSDLS